MQPAKLVSIVFTPWRKYSDYFKQNSHGVWLLKEVLITSFIIGLILCSIILYAIINPPVDFLEAPVGIFSVVATLSLFAIWIVYTPILLTVVIYRFILGAKSETLKTYKLVTKQVTPKELYTKPYPSALVSLVELRDYVIDFLDWCTQFFPFDLIFPDRIRYPLTKKLRHNARYIESLFAYLKVPLKYIGSEINMQYTVYKFEFYEEIKDVEKIIKKIEKKANWTGFYIRRDEESINIVDPHREK